LRKPRFGVPWTFKGEKTMKSAIVLATVIAAVALGACRKEVRHESMKLGADVPVERTAR